MILLYHKIDSESKNYWWVSADRLYRQLVQLSSKKVVYLDDYDPKNPEHVVITFDGVYDNVLKYAAPLLKKFSYPFELFITNDYIGKGNSFDEAEPDATFADKQQLKELIAMGGRLQWHTKTHRDITQLTDKEVEQEIVCPAGIRKLDPKGFGWFAYAYGKYDERSQALVKKHYKGGLACDNGTYEDKTIWPRKIVSEETELLLEKVSVIIPCYNYGHFLVEAIDSVLRQTYLPDEILLSDDASTDHSYQIMKTYAQKYPDLIKLNRNAQNMGIEGHFNKIVKKTSGDFVCLLGADNRFPSNYLEECLKALSSNDKVAIAYTDFALFGTRAEEAYKQFGYQGDRLELGVFITKFPEFTAASKKVLLEKRNFIHGSSMYRRTVFEEVGGYKSRGGGAEDYTLFQGMVRGGWQAKKAPVYLEYRQHSSEQANQQFSYFGEIAFLRQQFIQQSEHIEHLGKEINRLRQIEAEVEKLRESVRQAHEENEFMKRSKFWKMRDHYWRVKRAVRDPHKAAKKIVRKLKRG